MRIFICPRQRAEDDKVLGMRRAVAGGQREDRRVLAEIILVCVSLRALLREVLRMLHIRAVSVPSAEIPVEVVVHGTDRVRENMVFPHSVLRIQVDIRIGVTQSLLPGEPLQTSEHRLVLHIVAEDERVQIGEIR